MEFDYSAAKNLQLLRGRGIGFEEMIFHIKNNLLDVVMHPNRVKFPHQEVFVIDVEGYVYLVPFLRQEARFFLKTLYPSRKFTKLYMQTQEKNQ